MDITSIAEGYERNPILRSLVQLIPMGIGSAADTGLTTYLNNIRAKRIKTFFETLDISDGVLSEEDIKNEDFLHAYFSTMRAVINTRRNEKIQLFVLLFSTFANNQTFNEIDEYEELLSTLDDLHYSEFKILLILNNYETKYPIKNEQNGLQRSSQFWNDFIKEVEDKLGIQKEELFGALARLNRTGLYQTFIGNYMGYTGNQGYLTPLFNKLILKITR